MTDSTGRLLSRYPLSVQRTLDPQPVYLLKNALQEVVRSGTAKALPGLLPAGVSVAGKTGTTDDLRDSWFAGFDQRYAAVVWIGRDDNAPIGLSGSSGAMRVWGALLRSLGVSSLSQSPPTGIEMVVIDSESGLLGEGCDHSQTLPFIRGSAPTRYASCAHRPGRALDEGINWLQRLFE